MPVPKPRKGEKEKDYMSRCMGDDVMVDEYPDQKVRGGICSTQWDSKNLTEWIDGLQLTNKKAEPKEDIMLFPYGEFDHPVYGKLNFDNDFFNEIINNYQNNVLHVKPFMDKQHDEDKALAWFDTSPFIRPGQGLFISPEYTELGDVVLKSKTYRYFSPAWGPYKDPQSGKEFKNVLMGGAATNIPFLKTMPTIIDETAVLDSKGMAEYKLTDLTTKGSSYAGGKADDSTNEQTPKEANNKTNIGDKMKEVKKLFSLSDDAVESEVVASIEDLKKENADLKAKVAELEAKSEAEKELSDKLNDANKKISDMETKLTEKDRDEVIQKALTEGKILPADKDHWEKRYMSDPKNVGEDLKKMHAVVDFSETGKSGEGEKNDDPGKKLVAEAKKLSAERKITFEAAIAEIAETNPQLTEAYNKAYQA